MKTSPAGIKALRLSEGAKTTAYQDSVGVWTIGVGHTAAAGPPSPKKGMTITLAEVDELLAKDIVQYEQAILKAVKVPLNQNEFDALTNWCFNIGTGAMAKSTLVRKLNAGDRKGAADQFLVWNKAGGEVLNGLVKRRERERAMFLKPVSPTEAPQKPVKTPPATELPETQKSPWMTFIEFLIKLFKRT